MRAGQGERSRGVIERGAGPIRSAVTDRTIQREARTHMVWICSAVIESNVAGIAIRRSTREHIVHMALSTGNCGVRTSERERSLRVIKHGA